MRWNWSGNRINLALIANGKGSVRKTVTLKIDIPAGVDSDSIIQFVERASLVVNGGLSGDLYIVINVSHTRFTREWYDLISDDAYFI